MADTWLELRQLFAGGSDPLGMCTVVEEARALAANEPEAALRLLADAGRDLRDASLPVDVFAHELAGKAPAWAEESAGRLRAAIEEYFQRGLADAEDTIEREVGHWTQFGEMAASVKSGFRKWNDTRKLKKEIKQFFTEAWHDPERRKRLSYWSDCMESDGALRTHIKRKHDEVTGEIPDDLWQEERSRAAKETKRIEAEGLEEFKHLEATGFFEARPNERTPMVARLDSDLIEAFIENGWIATERKEEYGEGKLGRLIERHFGQEALMHFNEDFFKEEAERFQAFWQEMARSAVLDVPRLGGARTRAVDGAPQAEMSAAAMAAVAATATPFLAAGVLAAGWHTMSWAMANLFPPMLLVSVPIALIAVVKGKQSTRDKMLRRVRVYCERMLAGQKLNVDSQYKRDAEQTARRFVDALRSKLLVDQVGLSSRNKLYRAMELIDRLCAELQGAAPVPQTDFLALAASALDRGDALAAAALWVQAYEGVVERWLARCDVQPPAQADRLRASIDLLRQRPEVPDAVAARLDALRRQRNRWAHGMGDLVELPAAEQARRVRRALDELGRSAA